MTTIQRGRFSIPLAVLILTQPAFGQDTLDLKKADARESAYNLIEAAQERFKCEIEEHTMRDVGHEPQIRYLFHIRAEGDECDQALVYLTNMAARQDVVIFRRLESIDDRSGDPLILFGQVLIHEVNPEIEEEKAPEE